MFLFLSLNVNPQHRSTWPIVSVQELSRSQQNNIMLNIRHHLYTILLGLFHNQIQWATVCHIKISLLCLIYCAQMGTTLLHSICTIMWINLRVPSVPAHSDVERCTMLETPTVSTKNSFLWLDQPPHWSIAPACHRSLLTQEKTRGFLNWLRSVYSMLINF